MRLSSILSKPPSSRFKEVEGFLGEKNIKNGTHKKIDVGVIALSFFCKKCEEMTTFYAGRDNEPALYCIIINNKLVSIDCSLKCPRCNSSIPTWFIIESEDNMISRSVNCRILKRRENLSDTAMYFKSDTFGDYTHLLEKANIAYREGLGAAAMVYLRKTFEQITCAAADNAKINRKTPTGGRKKFQDLLKEVDGACKIIPDEFSSNGYELFCELSNVLHGDYDEKLGLEKYEYLRRLIVGIIENIRNKHEYNEVVEALGWNNGDKK